MITPIIINKGLMIFNEPNTINKTSSKNTKIRPKYKLFLGLNFSDNDST